MSWEVKWDSEQFPAGGRFLFTVVGILHPACGCREALTRLVLVLP